MQNVLLSADGSEATSASHFLLICGRKQCVRFSCILLFRMQPVNTLIITARECVRALAEQRTQKLSPLLATFYSFADHMHMELRLAILRAATFWQRIWRGANWWNVDCTIGA